LKQKDADLISLSVPSRNTDQGVDRVCECLGVSNPKRAVKARACVTFFF